MYQLRSASPLSCYEAGHSALGWRFDMPVPRHSVAVPSVQLPVAAASRGVTELRVHGVGGTPPDAILGDLAPERVSGDAIAGFYRSSDHLARPGEADSSRHVEVYSWGGLTSRSKI